MKRVLLSAFLCVVGFSALYAQYQIELNDASSLVRTGMNPHPTQEGDSLLASVLLDALEKQDADSIAFACEQYRIKANEDLSKEKSYSTLHYILQRLINDGEQTEVTDLLTEDLYHYFTDNRCEHLKKYLTLKYELNNYRPQSIGRFIEERTFYDDFLMFNDPNRSAWDKTDRIMQLLPVKQGDKIVDVGCGFGYNAYRFAQLVGNNGMIYATDTEEPYVNYLRQFTEKHNLHTISPLVTTSNNISVPEDVDIVFMSSLYHIIYTWSREDERNEFIASVKQKLKIGGYFVIVDNYNLHGEELNNCYVDPRLVEAQLGYWGFQKTALHTLSDQRYMLVLQHQENFTPTNIIGESEYPILTIDDKESIVHIGSLDSYDITEKGISAASEVYKFLEEGDECIAEKAIAMYESLIPNENFGGEYSAIQWLCEALSASPHKLKQMLRDPLTRSFYNKMTEDNCRTLKYYLMHKYKLGTEEERMLSDSLLEKSGEVGRTHRSYLDDYILALNPKRESWEKTSLIMESLNLKKGETIADIGSGSGFFTYRFSQKVGDKGKVYALEMKDEHIKSLTDFVDKENIRNIHIIKGKENELSLPEKVDKIFMCSLYHIMYGVTSEKDRNRYLEDLTKCLKPNGELIIVDNGPVHNSILPYHGPYIRSELIEKQLTFFGFTLVEYKQIIPQRFLLRFKLNK